MSANCDKSVHNADAYLNRRLRYVGDVLGPGKYGILIVRIEHSNRDDSVVVQSRTALILNVGEQQ